MELSPIVLFVYNRPWHTQQTIEALQKCELATASDFFIFADGPKPNASEETKHLISEVRQYIHTIGGFRSIHIEESPENKGLANSVIYGVTKVIRQHGLAIVLEDDLIVHPFFLRFMNDALEFYRAEKRIYSIGAFNYNVKFPKSYQNDVYIVHRAESCGWGTWLDRWDGIDWTIAGATSFFKSKRKQRRFNRGGEDLSPMLKMQLNGEIDSWAIRWDYHLYKHNAYCLRPTKTLVTNIGFDGTGIHSGTMDTSDYSAPEYHSTTYSIRLIQNIKPNKQATRNFHDYWGVTPSIPMTRRIKRKIKKILRNIFSNHDTIKQNAINNNTSWYGGREYGGFSINDNSLNANSIIYSFGIGEDISFDKDLISQFGCHIFAFDPTPRAKHYVENSKVGDKFHFDAIGLANHDGKEVWHLPRNKEYVSCSVFNHENYTNDELDENTIAVEVQRLTSIMKRQGHTHIDLLKMDIEGSEFGVIDDILNTKLDIHQITLEFHPQMISNGNKRVNNAIRKMKRAGYKVIFYDPSENCCTLLKG